MPCQGVSHIYYLSCLPLAPQTNADSWGHILGTVHRESNSANSKYSCQVDGNIPCGIAILWNEAGLMKFRANYICMRDVYAGCVLLGSKIRSKHNDNKGPWHPAGRTVQETTNNMKMIATEISYLWWPRLDTKTGMRFAVFCLGSIVHGWGSCHVLLVLLLPFTPPYQQTLLTPFIYLSF